MKVASYNDPLELIKDIIADQVKVTLLCVMEDKKRQAYEFVPHLPELSREQISELIAEVVEMGLVARKIHVRKQPHFVEYALTNEGAMLVRCIRNMKSIGTLILDKYKENEKRRIQNKETEDILIKE